MGLFGKKGKGENLSADTSIQKRDIQYDSNLVTSLKNDHVDLKKLYANIGEHLNNKRYSELPEALLGFKARLQAHIMVENVRFYTYLEKSLQDKEDSSTMHDFRREMNDIAHKVVQFAKKYSGSGVTALTHSQFEKEYQEIGAILQQRITSEEADLYPLYQSIG